MFILLVVLLFVALGFLLAGFGLYMALRPKKSWQNPPQPPKFFGLDGKPRTLTPEELKQRKTAHITRRTAHSSSSHIHHTDEPVSTANAVTYSTFSTDNNWSSSAETSWNSRDSNSSSDWNSSSSSDTSWSSSSDSSSSSSSDSGSSSSSDFGGGGSGGDW